MAVIDETHDPQLESWVASANRPGCDFPIQNLPLARFVNRDVQRIGVGIGNFLLDIHPWLAGDDLSAFFRLPPSDRTHLRKVLSRALRQGSQQRELIAQDDCEFVLPCVIGDYTDFYASIDHARNVGALFRPDNPLMPNYRHMPVAYHGRSSSIAVSGTPIIRPSGQMGEGQFGPSVNLDYEVELGAFIGPGNAMGEPIPISATQAHVAGACVLNDWSARDIQRWEYQPLGPFLGKNFATTISPWVVTAEALAPFEVRAPAEDRIELPYLRCAKGALDITVEAYLRPAHSDQAYRLSQASFRDMYWTFPQMIAHHTVNGCPLRPGDLIGSGTISGPEKSNRGCLLELSANGREPVHLRAAVTRSFLADGDEVTLRAHCERSGFVRIGFGACSGIISPAHHV